MGRQRSRHHIREQNRDPDIRESSNLTDAEFKTLVIKVLSELWGSVDKFSENFNQEIKNIKMQITKGIQSEMKNTLSDMRSILNGINKRINKVNEEKDQMPYLDDGKAKDTQSEWQEMRCQGIYKNNLRSIWDTIKSPNIHLIGVTEEN